MDDLSQFKGIYITECFELLEEMETKLLGLNTEQPDREDLNAIFRCAHSIKGGAGAFGLTNIAAFTHILEALLDKMREEEIPVSPEAVDTLLRSRDVLQQMVTAAQNDTPLADDFGKDLIVELESFAGIASPIKKVTQTSATKKSSDLKKYLIHFKPLPEMFGHGNDPLLLIRELKGLGKNTVNVDTSLLPALEQLEFDKSYLSWTIELETDLGEAAIKEIFEFVEDDCLLTIMELEGEDSSVAETAPTKKILEDKDEAAKAASVPVAKSIRVDIDKVDKLINMVGEVVITQAFLSAQVSSLPAQGFLELTRGVEEMMHHTRELQEAVMAIRMQPVKSLFSRMPRLVRDLSVQLGKDIVLEMTGENTEVDKTIIEQLSDPLTHMIRNSVDHGIEMPDVRQAAGKPKQGIINLSAEHRGGRIVIEVSDNGGGINREKVLRKAKEKGLVAPEAQLTDEEIDMLIFAAGFSTAEVVSNVSGRGVGMDVVRRNIESLGGTVHVKNNPGQGSVFAISLPLTLAILDGMIVRCGAESYIIPINNIIETMRPKAGQVKFIADGNHVINVRGEFIPVTYLYKLFNIEDATADASAGLVVLVENGKEQFGVVVDELVGQQQVVIKSLEENADPIEGISGATILGDGKVALILDVAKLYALNKRHIANDNHHLLETPQELQL